MQLFSRRVNGFTLVEILLVLVILGLLASILFAVFARVREEGRRATCEGNLHQIGLALQQYTSDNSGIYPALEGYGTTASGAVGGTKWSDMIQPYLKSVKVFNCPTHTERYPEGVSTPAAPMILGVTGDYHYDWFKIANAQHKLNRFGENATEIGVPLPAQAPLIYDAGWIGDDKSLHYMDAFKDDGRGNHICYHSVHEGGANFLFVDGHVKWFSVAQQDAHQPVPLAPWLDWSPFD